MAAGEAGDGVHAGVLESGRKFGRVKRGADLWNELAGVEIEVDLSKG